MSEEPKNFWGIKIQSSKNTLYIKNNSKQPLLPANNSEGSANFRKPRIIKELVLSWVLQEDHSPKKKENKQKLYIPLMSGSTAQQEDVNND